VSSDPSEASEQRLDYIYTSAHPWQEIRSLITEKVIEPEVKRDNL